MTPTLTPRVPRAGYHSLFEWYNPIYLADKAANFATTVYVDEVWSWRQCQF